MVYRVDALGRFKIYFVCQYSVSWTLFSVMFKGLIMEVALICLSAAPCLDLIFCAAIEFAPTFVTASLDAAGTRGLSNGVPIVKQ